MTYLDLRDLVKERDELRDRRDDEDQDDPLDEEETERLEEIEGIDGQLGGDLDGWANNEPIAIPESDFEDYCRNLADDCGYTNGGDDNPLLNYIDWERWAADCRHDYSGFDFDGDSYLVRSY